MTTIGVYGGTFDPVHIGHLAVAESVREAARLDQILFVPNHTQPLKEHGPWASAEQRLRMLRVAIAGNPAFAISEIELARPSPSYTIDTLDALQQALPAATLRFIMGADAANGLADWRAPERIMAEYAPIITSRGGWAGPDWDTLARIRADARALAEVIEVPDLAIASRAIRARVGAGRSIRYLVPDAVLQIIEDERIYRDPPRRARRHPSPI